MGVAKLAAAASAVVMLGACGGGGGSAGGGPAPTPTPSTATLPVTLSATSATVVVPEGQTQTFGFTASHTGTSTQPVVANVAVGGTRYALEGTPTASGTSFAVTLKTAALAPGGRTTSTVTFRLCTSADCSTVYPGSTQTFTVDLDVQLKDWETQQRNAAHDGYVAVAYKTADFAPAWSISTAPYRASNVAASRGAVFFNTQSSTGNVLTKAVNTADGTSKWTFDHGPSSYFSGPSYSSGRVASMVMNISSGSIPLQILDAGNGSSLRRLTYASQFSNGGTPTPLGTDLYFQAGYYGNVVYAGNAATGDALWTRDTTQPAEGYVQQGESVAADANYVYFFGGGNLFALARATGAIAKKIRNPYFSMFGLSYFGGYEGGPILGPGGRIVTFTDHNSGGVSVPLMANSIASDTPLWRTNRSYVGIPALRIDRLFAARGDNATIDVIDIANGSVLTSVDLGGDKGTLRSNIVVTGSHLFVSNGSSTFALDLQATGYPLVWTVPKGGSLAITPENYLIVAGQTEITAYKLS